ncbi:tubulin-specific chaperone D, partial [Tremellales sp. Uapishka_1]
MAQPLEDDSDPTYTHFAHRTEFLQLLDQVLAVNIEQRPSIREDEVEEGLVAALGAILDHYLPLPALLDPSLDLIVPPLLAVLSKHLTRVVEAEQGGQAKYVDADRIGRIGQLVNWVVKVRGWKATGKRPPYFPLTTVPHFPSSIPHLPLLIFLLSPSTSPSSSTTPPTPHHPLISAPSQWELRAVLLLWLALLLTVPFNLSALSPSTPSPAAFGMDLPSLEKLFPIATSELAERVTLLSIPLLSRPGKEGSYAALVLARLFAREDAVQGLPGFLAWSGQEIMEGEREGESNLVASILMFLSLLPPLIGANHLTILHDFSEAVLLPHLRGSRTAASSGLIRKLAIKARGRWWLARIGKGWSNDEDAELPNGLEEELDDLMGGLGDKDTIVRYSCAKYLARIAALLPSSFSDQIVHATIDLFSGTENDPVIETSFGTIVDPGGSAFSGGTMGFGGLETTRGEARWHGVCLALAEIARRGLLFGDAIAESVKWVLEALTFDLRRASHSIGSNVRDAAAYLLWSISRACPPTLLEPFAAKMATSLICVAVFDREVGVRRAASAAFQEGVGRLGLYPEGIDVLRKTDFYAVSVRRMAFTVAAPSVAIYKHYRTAMREHLHHITLRHWDVTMRVLGANALREILLLDVEENVQDSMDREVRCFVRRVIDGQIHELSSLDAANVHGALVALQHVSSISSLASGRRSKIFDAMASIRPAALVSQQGGDILQASCDLFTNSVTPEVLRQPNAADLVDKFLDLSMKRREPEVQEAVAALFGRLSAVRDGNADDGITLISDLKSSRAAVKQAAALSLGHVGYSECIGMIENTCGALLGLMDPVAKADVETRRYAIRSLADILCQYDSAGNILISPSLYQSVVQLFILSLSDYSTDQRGDIGSWIRVVALNSLGRTLAHPFVPEDVFLEAVGAIIKQAVEKLEPVRQEAALALVALRKSGKMWEGVEYLKIDAGGGDEFRYSNQETWFASGMGLLETRFSQQLVQGLVQTVGSQVDSVSKLALKPLVAYFSKADAQVFSVVLAVLTTLLAENINLNKVFLPTVSTLIKLFSTETLGPDDPICARIINIVTRGISGMKSIDRLSSSMRLVIVMLSSANLSVRDKAVDALALFLPHRFPRIRSMCSEELYLALSNDDDVPPELEEVLLETRWSEEVGDAAEKVMALIKAGI